MGEPMGLAEPRPVLALKARWKRYVGDSLLSLGSILLLTAILFLFHVYPSIPDSFLVYLLAILALAGMRGLYAALLASFVAFFSFDFLFVPPIYSLLASKFEDVFTLIVFLAIAIVTSHLASALRQRAQDAGRRERETRILYDLLRATNREADMQHQLSIIAHEMVEVFFSWGMRECLFLLPDEQGQLIPHVSEKQLIEHGAFSTEEAAVAARAMQNACTVDVDTAQLAWKPAVVPAQNQAQTGVAASQVRHYLRFIPLKMDQKVVGVLRLRIEADARSSAQQNSLGKDGEQTTPQGVFFSAFLEQAVASIERGRLLRETFHMHVLQQTDTLRAALLSSVSHSLRTPLSTIKTAATSLLEREVQWDEEARRSFTAAIEREADRLNALVENLLDMSRIEAGALHLEKVWYPVDELVRDVLARMRPQLQGRPVLVDIPCDIPPLELDYVQIDQVVTNLLENAINYTPAGSPIDVSMHNEGESVCISIADRGPGIALAEREYIFDKFYRVLGGSARAQYTRGSGLGLAICRGFVEAHGGNIWVEARAGGGAVFHFTLPLSEMGELQL